MPRRRRLILVIKGLIPDVDEVVRGLSIGFKSEARVVAVSATDEVVAVLVSWPPHVVVVADRDGDGELARLGRVAAALSPGSRVLVAGANGIDHGLVREALRAARPRPGRLRRLALTANGADRHPFALAFEALGLADKVTARLEGGTVAALKAFRARTGRRLLGARNAAERRVAVAVRLLLRKCAGGGG
ncbi:MAG TPA: hypothetical protein VG389_13770 [Myxococcota bacterium]|jgi:hypothetical protein|nr:hypothetical protein [Myxococcota bacterium]